MGGGEIKLNGTEGEALKALGQPPPFDVKNVKATTDGGILLEGKELPGGQRETAVVNPDGTYFGPETNGYVTGAKMFKPIDVCNASSRLTERSRFSFKSWGETLDKAILKRNKGGEPTIPTKCWKEEIARNKAPAGNGTAAVAKANTKAVPPSENPSPIRVGSTIPTKPQPNKDAKPSGSTTKVADSAKPAKLQPTFGDKMIDFVKTNIRKIQDRYDESFPFFSGNVSIYFEVDYAGKPISSDVDSSNPVAFMLWNDLRKLRFPPSPYGVSAYDITFGFNANTHVASYVGGVAYPELKQ